MIMMLAQLMRDRETYILFVLLPLLLHSYLYAKRLVDADYFPAAETMRRMRLSAAASLGERCPIFAAAHTDLHFSIRRCRPTPS